MKNILSVHSQKGSFHFRQRKTVTQKFTKFRKSKDHLIVNYVSKKNWILHRSDFFLATLRTARNVVYCVWNPTQGAVTLFIFPTSFLLGSL